MNNFWETIYILMEYFGHILIFSIFLFKVLNYFEFLTNIWNPYATFNNRFYLPKIDGSSSFWSFLFSAMSGAMNVCCTGNVC